MNKNELHNLGTGERVARMAATAVLIGTTLTYSGDLGYLTLLPLLSIYTGITALIGWDPIAAAVDSLSEDSSEQGVRFRGAITAS